jgi:hypothetical protein
LALRIEAIFPSVAERPSFQNEVDCACLLNMIQKHEVCHKPR